MKTKIEQETTNQFVKFGIIGISNTVVSLLVYYALISLNINYIIANTFGFIAGVLNAYFWNNKYVFDTKVGVVPQMKSLTKVFLTYGFTFILNTAFLVIMVNYLDISSYIAPIINAIIITPLNFVINKYWAFK